MSIECRVSMLQLLGCGIPQTWDVVSCKFQQYEISLLRTDSRHLFLLRLWGLLAGRRPGFRASSTSNLTLYYSGLATGVYRET